jgi:formylglycine-generating enzyme required for sulfatase activity
MRHFLFVSLAPVLVVTAFSGAAMNDPRADLRKSLAFYASFDEEIRGDFGGGVLTPSTRRDNPDKPGEFIFTDGFDAKVFRIANDKGIRGGALEALDVLPHRGRIFFPAKGNLPFKADGWSCTVSFWVNMDPNTMLKTPFCDPIQITQKGANDGGLWTDFPEPGKGEPRDFRLGVFPAAADGEKPIAESDPKAPLVVVKEIGFKQGEWHHVVMSCENLDTGKRNAVAALYIDGKRMGALENRPLAMRWDLDRTGIYVAVNYIGLLDELAIFNRPLSEEEIKWLHENPGEKLAVGWVKRPTDPVLASVPSAPTHQNVRGEVVSLDARSTPGGSARIESIRVAKSLGRVTHPTALLEDPAPPAPKFPFDAKAARDYQQAYSKWSGLPLEFTDHAGIKFVLCPPGEYLMGSPKDEPGHGQSEYDETQHPVRLTRPFYLSKHETTVGQFRDFVEATKYVTDGERTGGGHAHDEKAVWEHRKGTNWMKPGYAGPFELRDDQPVVHVSHTDANAYCKWLQAGAEKLHESNEAEAKSGEARRPLGMGIPSYSLPTEAQWEWACRAGAGGSYTWGDKPDETGKRINAGDKTLKRVHPQWPREVMPMDDGFGFVAPVGSYKANAFGLHDMLGNVWEFCSTRYGTFPAELITDPGDRSTDRGFAVRGGGWSNLPRDVRCASRNADPPHFCHSNLGFRVALQLGAP